MRRLTSPRRAARTLLRGRGGPPPAPGLEAEAGAPRVLITDAGERSMLATCRGLAAAGYRVSAAAADPLALTRWSRFCSEFVHVTDPRIDAVAFIEDLSAYLQRRPCALLIPGSDASLLAISAARDRLETLTRLGLPSHAVVLAALDRRALADAATQAGLAPAVSTLCSGPEDAAAAAARLGFPVLLKSSSVARQEGERIVSGRRTVKLSDQSALAQQLHGGEPFLIQRAVAGRTMSFGGVVADGRLLAWCLSRYERTRLPAAGNVSFSVTIACPPESERALAELLHRLHWEGMFELEVIQTDGGELVPIDFNPRPYGSMALAIAAGTNLPALWCDWLRGEAGPPQTAQPSRRYRWADGDLVHLISQLREGNLGAIATILRPWPGVVHPHFRSDDPLPVLGRLLRLARNAAALRSPRERERRYGRPVARG